MKASPSLPALVRKRVIISVVLFSKNKQFSSERTNKSKADLTQNSLAIKSMSLSQFNISVRRCRTKTLLDLAKVKPCLYNVLVVRMIVGRMECLWGLEGE